MNQANQIAALFGVGLLLAVAVAALTEGPPAPPARDAIVMDASGSTPATLCEDVARIAALLPADQDRTVALYVMGSRKISPRLLGTNQVARTRVVAEQIQQDHAQNPLRDWIIDQCAAVAVQPDSPIHAAVAMAVSDLGDCSQTSCTVYVRTDGLEEVEPGLVARLAGRKGTPAQIANPAVTVQFCGVAQRPKGPTQSTIESAWKEVFTNPERVTFASNCGAYSEKK